MIFNYIHILGGYEYLYYLPSFILYFSNILELSTIVNFPICCNLAFLFSNSITNSALDLIWFPMSNGLSVSGPSHIVKTAGLFFILSKVPATGHALYPTIKSYELVLKSFVNFLFNIFTPFNSFGLILILGSIAVTIYPDFLNFLDYL